jgi:translation elongation factor EF-1beta
MTDTYTLVLTREETLLVAVSVYLAMSILSKDKKGTLEAIAELLQTDENIVESAGTKLEKVILSA